MWFGSWTSSESKSTAPESNSRRRMDAETEGTTAGSGLQDVTFGSSMVASLGRPNWGAPAFKVLTDLNWCPRSQPERAAEVINHLELALQLSGLTDTLHCHIPASVDDVARLFPDMAESDLDSKYNNLLNRLTLPPSPETPHRKPESAGEHKIQSKGTFACTGQRLSLPQ